MQTAPSAQVVLLTEALCSAVTSIVACNVNLHPQCSHPAPLIGSCLVQTAPSAQVVLLTEAPFKAERLDIATFRVGALSVADAAALIQAAAPQVSACCVFVRSCKGLCLGVLQY